MDTAPAAQPGSFRGWARSMPPGWVRRAWTDSGGKWRPAARDMAIATLITVIAVLASYGEAHPANSYFTPPHHLPHTPDPALLIVAAGGVALAWRMRYPRLVLCLTTASTVAYSLPGYLNGTSLLLPAFALATLAAQVPVRRSVVWAVAVTAVLMAATAANNPLGWAEGGFWIIPANNTGALFAGIAVVSRNSYLKAARLQAAQRAEQDAQRQVEEERLRIARELHDVVAHTMATITVQAAAATQLLRDRPDEAAESLKAIRTASKDGLRELRAILKVLRTTDDGTDPTQPAPGLSRLDTLVAGVRASGLPVKVTVTGRPRSLPAVTDLSAFRIIQEALTNTLRHAGPATAAVALDYGADELRVEVTDDGHGLAGSYAKAAFAAYLAGAGHPATAPAAVSRDRDEPGAAGGHGLRGMRERAMAAGGTIEIGPLGPAGFRVAAALPTGPAPAGSAPAASGEPVGFTVPTTEACR